jgi:hypothetical protein
MRCRWTCFHHKIHMNHMNHMKHMHDLALHALPLELKKHTREHVHTGVVLKWGGWTHAQRT